MGTGDLIVESARLEVAADTVAETEAFYADWTGVVQANGGPFTFAPAAGPAFHHFALLVPGGRFVAAREWLVERAPLLADPDTGETSFDFDDWDAWACYFADPAGNIVELIAHAELCVSERSGPFDPGEFCGISELGLVVADRAAARATLAEHGLHEWSGWEGFDGLSFVGIKGYTLILSGPDRGWLPTGVPAVACAGSAVVAMGDARVAVSVRDGVLTADAVG
jgi:catechol 2,3-dioxygenase-like lactoylglutathione lyase family enzyme